MRIRLQRDIDKLKRQVVSLATLVEERFRLAVRAVECRDAELARMVILGDAEIDQKEVDIEEECLKILALHQPVADHLRYIVSVLKLNNDLERIGDLAVNIAQKAEVVATQLELPIPFDYVTMSQRAGEMLEESLNSLVNLDLHLAYRVCAQDDEVDFMKSAMQQQFADEIRKTKDEHIESLIHLFLISRHLERIADHATNIAEDVIYMITGEIHRHRGFEYHQIKD
jgi:phosphate transport system protein